MDKQEEAGLEKDLLIMRKMSEAFERDDHRWCISKNTHLEDRSGYISLAEYADRLKNHEEE